MSDTTQPKQPVYLRALEFADLERTLAWHNDRALYATLASPFRFVSRATEEDWLRQAQAASPQQINLAICQSERNEHIGNIYLRDIDWVARRAELHIFIGDPQQRGKGYGRTAVRLLIDYAFGDLGLHRIYLLVLADNTPAICMYEACGLVCEGTLRGHAFKGGAYKDVLLMGLCHETVG